MFQECGLTEVEIYGRAFCLRPVSPGVPRWGNVVGTALAESLGKSYPWSVGFLFGDLDPSMNLWTVIAGISGFDD